MNPTVIRIHHPPEIPDGLQPQPTVPHIEKHIETPKEILADQILRTYHKRIVESINPQGIHREISKHSSIDRITTITTISITGIYGLFLFEKAQFFGRMHQHDVPRHSRVD